MVVGDNQFRSRLTPKVQVPSYISKVNRDAWGFYKDIQEGPLRGIQGDGNDHGHPETLNPKP